MKSKFQHHDTNLMPQAPSLKPRIRFPDSKFNDVKSLLNAQSEIIITTHHRPDGDAMGSSLGLYNFLKKKGYRVTVITPSEYPDFLYWLPGNEKVLVYENSKAECDKLIEKSSMIFCLDFNWFKRLEGAEDSIRKSNAKKILIDHHLDPENSFDIIFSDSDACSTCELVYDFIVRMHDQSIIDKQIAECIYCGIMTDTNSFRFSSMKSDTHRIIAELMDAGAENYRIHERVYDNSNESKLRLLGYSLLEKLVVLEEFNTAYIVLTAEEHERFNYKTGDTEGLVNYALGINKIRLGVFFAERDGVIKISFRSKGDFSVKDLSSKYFGGGGHKNASGGFSNDSISNTVKRFLEILPSYKKQLTEK